MNSSMHVSRIPKLNQKIHSLALNESSENITKGHIAFDINKENVYAANKPKPAASVAPSSNRTSITVSRSKNTQSHLDDRELPLAAGGRISLDPHSSLLGAPLKRKQQQLAPSKTNKNKNHGGTTLKQQKPTNNNKKVASEKKVNQNKKMKTAATPTPTPHPLPALTNLEPTGAPASTLNSSRALSVAPTLLSSFSSPAPSASTVQRRRFGEYSELPDENSDPFSTLWELTRTPLHNARQQKENRLQLQQQTDMQDAHFEAQEVQKTQLIQCIRVDNMDNNAAEESGNISGVQEISPEFSAGDRSENASESIATTTSEDFAKTSEEVKRELKWIGEEVKGEVKEEVKEEEHKEKEKEKEKDQQKQEEEENTQVVPAHSAREEVPLAAPLTSVPTSLPTPVPTSLDTSASLQKDAAFNKLCEGQTILKYGRKGQPHLRFVWLDSASSALCWTEAKKGYQRKVEPSRCVSIASVVDVLKGAYTKVFSRYQKKLNSEDARSRCVSLVTTRRTLDLEFTSVGRRDEWLACVECLL